MKHMKILIAILAIAFVVVGSSFTSKKAFNSKTYGILSRNFVSSGDHAQTYHYTLAEVNTGECGSGAIDEKCKVELDLDYTGTYIIQNSTEYDIWVTESQPNVVLAFPVWPHLFRKECFYRWDDCR